MRQHPLLEGMNPQQAEAITAGAGPVLVLAGPGSGKTRVLTRRIAYLIHEQDVPHHRIMAVTFTNKAAGEMRSRIEKLLGDRLRGLQIGTFHAICARFLRMEAESIDYKQDYVIYDRDDQYVLVRQVMNRLDLDPKRYNPRAILARISSAKSEMILPQDFQSLDYFSEIAKQVYGPYQKSLRDANAMDFDDLLLNMVLLLRDNEVLRERYQSRFEYVLVDEFQDTNKVQYELVKYLAAPQNNVFVVGDEDQAIYAFRGANYRNVLRYRDDYPAPTVILLEQNYRSTQNILDAARAVIDHNRNRTPKALHTDKGRGEPIYIHEAYNERYEAEYVLEQIHQLRRRQGCDYRDFAVMYRTNAQSRAMEQAFVNEGVPYVLVGGVGFYKRREVKDLLAYLRLIHNPDDRVSFGRIINVPKRGIGKKSLGDFIDWVTREGITISEALNRLFYKDPVPLSAAVRKKFTAFAEWLSGWQDMAKAGDLLTMFDSITAQTGYFAYLNDSSKLPEEAADRSDNVRELRGLLEYALEDDQPLHEFLAEQSLVADVASLTDDTDAAALMTLQAAKGLEYPVVVITGLERGILPHSRSLEEKEGIEEERRLFYVGVTRAKRTLHLSYAFRRALYGGGGALTSPSEFLVDLPLDLLRGSPTTLASLPQAQSHPSQGRSQVRWYLPTSGFQPGNRVSHPEFGEGEVIDLESHDDIVNVLFDEHGLKKILADADGFRLIDG